MKHLLHLIALTCLILSFTACGDATTNDNLPAGTAPNRADTDTALSDGPEANGAVAVTPPANPQETGANTNDSNAQSNPEDQDSDQAVSEQPAERQQIPGLSYVMPLGWTAGPKKQMRLLTLIPTDAFEGAELSVFLFDGDVGGFGSNVVRWAGQVGIQFVREPSRTDYQQLDVDGKTAVWVPLVGESRAILAVWVPIGENPDKPNQTWTFKLSCSTQQAEALEPVIKQWLDSIKFE